MLNDLATGEKEQFDQLPELLRQAVKAHQAGHLDAAFPLYQNYVDQNPAHPMALQLLGLLHSQRGEYEAAIPLMQQSLRLFPEQAEVANNLGNVLRRSGRLEEAAESYRRAIQLVPGYADALRNLARCYLDMHRYRDADDTFNRCLEIDPQDAPSWLGRGGVQEKLGDYERAMQCYNEALRIRPDYAEAHHNIGVCLRVLHRPKEAISHYRVARNLGLDRAELFHNLGNALNETQDAAGAIDAYRQALERNMGDVNTHRNLNALLWQQDMLDDYLSSYETALERYPDARDLRLAWAVSLAQQEDFIAAEEVLRAGLQLSPHSAELKSQLAYSLEGQGRWEDALRVHEEAVAEPESTSNQRVSFARALLACQRPDDALQHARMAAAKTPFDQRALAYLALCWRLLDDERDQVLNDYENLVRVYDLPLPPGFSSGEEFNSRLADALMPLHIAKRHPSQQTLRGGSQTTGNLFARTEPEIAELVRSLESCISDYVSSFPDISEHPLFARRRDRFSFAASWSVRLANKGFHTMHIHPLGWISSAYYVQVPGEIVESDRHGGGLKFGEPDIDIGAAGEAKRTLQPAVGRLVLFPSYMWHGTIPFESDDPRMTVAFDVVPEMV